MIRGIWLRARGGHVTHFITGSEQLVIELCAVHSMVDSVARLGQARSMDWRWLGALWHPERCGQRFLRLPIRSLSQPDGLAEELPQGLRIRYVTGVFFTYPSNHLSWCREHGLGGVPLHLRSSLRSPKYALSTIRFRYLGLRFGRALLPQRTLAVEVKRLGQLHTCYPIRSPRACLLQRTLAVEVERL
jgi:hypothetical protein